MQEVSFLSWFSVVVCFAHFIEYLFFHSEVFQICVLHMITQFHSPTFPLTAKLQAKAYNVNEDDSVKDSIVGLVKVGIKPVKFCYQKERFIHVSTERLNENTALKLWKSISKFLNVISLCS